MSFCNVCPRSCKVDRKQSIHEKGRAGYCRSGMLPIVSRAALHHWEEPCISGTRGAGTVFFAGCNLSCVYCQNYEISELMHGEEISVERLRQIYFELIAQGAHNIDLVTPTHFTHAIFQSLREPLPVPVVYNCGGYESVHTVAFLRKKIQCWLPDLKYSLREPAARYSDAPDYFEKATAAIEQMYRQTGPYEIGSDGILKKGVLIRHLILPGNLENTKGVLRYVAETFAPGQVLFSLMRQYVPWGRAAEFPEINRRLTEEEYNEAEACMEELGIVDGYTQEADSSDAVYIPAFNGAGVREPSKEEF
ncbi:4Fe-4S cluster-binding domain-containing protein [Allisonella histaminiformans]|uniref:Putative pyruvate formate lyase activating enzyme n=1 Tax=Allisonella histaminiformans TaxID=209880 RepID=A0A1G5UUZ1_9FIRM|nr:4Fe-4S cluster-binding domain-containing protein [Allisonella histaminiformans]PWL44507.1 MAG: radical SAM protein [Veillonellaceae bacterium]MCI6003936.1 4Fe-4S cluster-binding domain-containing protein [Allisonella histaminiformans]MDD6870786.1 4Fe-4S cluster-binding domain-containing protein [Allisonella histaminiformans]MDY3957510.1 4Fe-4S cluster-binding domain-containing protein [Allisonella histaminiformans]MDY4540368.1 4Fe-4S cluster-binding domain-containing protein [Allisonella hi